jgi:hypothetical protein
MFLLCCGCAICLITNPCSQCSRLLVVVYPIRQEEKMRNSNLLRYHRQRPLFESERQRLWERLPEPDQRRCLELLVQLLGKVVQREAKERSQHERQD